jgi:hypothetical protein
MTVRPLQIGASEPQQSHRRIAGYKGRNGNHPRADARPPLTIPLQCTLMMLWTAPPPAPECHGCVGAVEAPTILTCSTFHRVTAQTLATASIRVYLWEKSPFALDSFMGSSEAYDCNRRSRRRNEDKRRRVEVAVERLGLTPEAGKALSEGIYRLYRNLVAQKSRGSSQLLEWAAIGERKMRAAIYARYSSENQSVSSITDQIEVCSR